MAQLNERYGSELGADTGPAARSASGGSWASISGGLTPPEPADGPGEPLEFTFELGAQARDLGVVDHGLQAVVELRVGPVAFRYAAAEEIACGADRAAMAACGDPRRRAASGPEGIGQAEWSPGRWTEPSAGSAGSPREDHSLQEPG